MYSKTRQMKTAHLYYGRWRRRFAPARMAATQRQWTTLPTRVHPRPHHSLLLLLPPSFFINLEYFFIFIFKSCSINLKIIHLRPKTWLVKLRYP